ncbi:DUF1156 domain-containing protein, partial [bacterium]|nr:DUF1156 domain-containing protein [bacterium]
MHPRRLIEADLPIATISREARREKSIRRGHISTLHIWWARRPLAACRAVLLAALLPDPADESCPPSFRERARALLAALPGKQGKRAGDLGDPLALRNALLDLIGEASSWEKARDGALLEACRGLVLAGNEALGGEGPPLVVDPFAGGGTIPLEALRVGARAFSSDLNPVAVLLEKVLLELTPEHGERLAREVRSWGEKIRREAARELGKLYPTARGERPVAWLWARTIRCEGPRCGSEVPLLRSLTVVGRGKTRVSLRLFPNRRKRQVGIEIVHGAARAGEGTVKRATVTCPVCGFTTRVARVRAQLCSRRGGARDA